MKSLTTTPMALMILIAVMATQLVPSSAKAGYPRGEELPGMNGTKILLITTGVVLGGFLLYSVLKKDADGDVKVDANKPEASPSSVTDKSQVETTESSETEADDDAVSGRLDSSSDGHKVGFFMGLSDDSGRFGASERAMDFSDLTIKAGITIGF